MRAGLLYLITLPTAGPWYYISAAQLGGGATLESLRAAQGMLELVIVLGAVGHTAQLIAAVLLCFLLRNFGRIAASLALALLAISVPLAFAAMAREAEILAQLDNVPTLSLLGSALVQTQIDLMAGGYTSVVGAASCFWGLWLVPLGWVLLRSKLVPRVIAVCVMLGGPFYMSAFIGPIFDPAFASSVVANVIGIVSGIPDLIGELGTALWLLVRGAPAAIPIARDE